MSVVFAQVTRRVEFQTAMVEATFSALIVIKSTRNQKLQRTAKIANTYGELFVELLASSVGIVDWILAFDTDLEAGVSPHFPRQKSTEARAKSHPLRPYVGDALTRYRPIGRVGSEKQTG